MSSLNLYLIIFSVFVIAIGQTAMKYASQKLTYSPGQSLTEILQTNMYPIGIILLAILSYLISTVAWIIALRTVPLSVAYMFNSAAFLIIPALSVLFFSEELPKYYFASLGLIVAAIILLTR